MMKGPPGPGNAKGRRDALAILAALLDVDGPGVLPEIERCEPSLAIIALACMVCEALHAAGIVPSEWVAEQQGPAGTPPAWQN